MRFRSVHIVGFLVAGLVLTALAGGWALEGMRTLQWKSAQEQEVELVMRAIEGGALKFAQLNSTELATQFLGSHLTALSPEGTPRFLSARIEGGRSGNETYAFWSAAGATAVPASCSKIFERQIVPQGALYPFRVRVVANACWENPAVTTLVRAALWAPLIVSCGLLGVLGLSLVAMMASVKQASEILRRTPDSVEVVTLANRVPWKEVRTMLTRALETSGANLHYFQAIIEEAEHDVNREITRATPEREQSRGGIVSSIMRKLVLDSQIAARKNDLNTPPRRWQITLGEVHAFIKDQGFEVDGKPVESTPLVSFADGDAFTRLVLNLGSNARKHARGTPRCFVKLDVSSLVLTASNRIGFYQNLRMRMSSILGALDLSDPTVPLLRTWWSREGIGSRVLKRSAKVLGATISIAIEKRHFIITVAIPVQTQLPAEASPVRRRAVSFQSTDLIDEALRSGFSGTMLSPEELRYRVTRQEVDEVMVDFPLPDAPDSIVIRNATTTTRVRGIVNLWRGDLA